MSDRSQEAPAEHGEDPAHQQPLSRARELIRAVPTPALPLEEEWSAGLGHLVRAAPGFPERLSRFLSPLDRLAEVRLTPDVVGFDGADVRWAEVTELRLGSVTDLLSAGRRRD